MEGMVCHDDLWTSLQVNLWNAQRSDSPTPSKLRVFEDCCTVLDIAFSALEDSEKVDWRAPEFGSLAQHFELFIAHCSQGAFMARTTSFRVGIIKARICKAVLSQFRDDLVREGTLFFRSEWDAASLARLICTLGTGDGEAAEFWKSYVDWGHIGAEFTPKARQMVDEAARDGPLLIFCKLGHLATTAVPLDGSGLGTRDIEKVLELQRNIIQDPRRPLTPASEKVWAELGQLQHQVSDLYSKNTSEDGDHLRHLLRMIDEVRHSHAPASKENSPSENAEAPGSKTLVAVKPRLLLRESRRSGRRSSFDSMSTLVTGGRSVASPNSEDSFGEHSAKTVLDPERNAHARWTSLPNDDAGSYHLPSPSHTIQSIPSEILDRTTSTVGIQPVNSSSPSFADTGQRLTLPSYAPARWNGSGRSAVRPRLTTVPGTGSLPTLRRNVSPIPVTSSPSGSFDLIGPGPSVVPPSPGVDQDERVN
ncbi:hypothetical protein BC826DRAFT_534404 [Russula brevipes]|nr:hypothetical protein BC826DRAFT_534404 [Russula brevipes]